MQFTFLPTENIRPVVTTCLSRWLIGGWLATRPIDESIGGSNGLFRTWRHQLPKASRSARRDGCGRAPGERPARWWIGAARLRSATYRSFALGRPRNAARPIAQVVAADSLRRRKEPAAAETRFTGYTDDPRSTKNNVRLGRACRLSSPSRYSPTPPIRH